MNLLNTIKPGTFFVFAALFLGILFNVFTPPLQAPDELNHFYRTYQVADGHFLPERTKDRLGGQVPVCFNEFILPYTFAATNLNYTLDKKDLLKSFDVKFSDEQKEFKDFPNTAYYSPVSYAPQALGIFILKQFNCSVATLYYGGRLFSFIFWLIIMYMAIRIIPVYKWLFALVILLPMNVYVANSFSADTVTNCCAILFIAFILRLAFCIKTITKKDLLIILALVVLLAMAKLVYTGLLILLFLIPVQKFGTQLKRYTYFLLFFSIAFLIVFLWSRTIMKYYITYADYNTGHNFGVGLSPCGNYNLQKQYILQHGSYFFKVIYHSVFNHPQNFLTSYIGVFGQGDIGLPAWIYIIAYAVILFLAFTTPNAYKFNVSQNLIILTASGLAFILLLLSQHLLWDCVGEGVVDLLQGRYLIPLFPLLFLLATNIKLNFKIAPTYIILPFLLLIYFLSFSNIYKRFFKETFDSKTEFYCDAESIDTSGFFITNNKDIKLEGAAFRVNTEHKRGNYSLQLSKQAQYGFSYKFKDLRKGDLVEIEGWKKGNDGMFVVSGKGKDCADYFIPANNTFFTGKDGWSKINNVITITENCTNSEIVFFAWNPGQTPVYFDDVKVSVKRYIKH